MSEHPPKKGSKLQSDQQTALHQYKISTKAMVGTAVGPAGQSISEKETVETAVRTSVHDAISLIFICAFDTDVRTSTKERIETAVGTANYFTSIQVTVGFYADGNIIPTLYYPQKQCRYRDRAKTLQIYIRTK